jgi:hypothetical protein
MRNIIKILTVLVSFSCLTSCFLNFGLTESVTLKEWNIEEYRIIYSRKLGPVGSHYYQYDVFKKKKHLSYTTILFDNDSCLLRFREKNHYYVDFNLCQQNKKILRPDKKKLGLNTIDSITIRPYDSIRLVPLGKPFPEPYFDTLITKNFDPTLTKKLNQKEIKVFVKKWNNSKANGLDRLSKSYEYQMTIYSKDSVRKIKILNNYLTENENWSYESKEDDFYITLWNNKK